MSQIIIKCICLIAIASLFGCGNDVDESPVVIPVLAEDALNDDATNTDATNTDATNIDNNTVIDPSASSESDEQSVDNEPTQNAETSTTGETTTSGTTNDLGATDSGTTDSGATDSTTTDSGATDSSATDSSTTDSSTTDSSTTDSSTTDSSTTDSSTTDAGATDAGTTDAGTTDSSTTDSSTTDAGATDSANATNESIYAVGSLASIVLEQGNLSMAFAAFKAAELDLAIDDPKNSWTIFLPTDDAIAANPMFDIQKHIYTSGAIQASGLFERTEQRLKMNNGESFFLTGGGVQPLKIAESTIIKEDLVCTTSTTVVHVIDKVLNDFVVLKYPEGSLADIMQTNENLSRVLKGLRADGFDRFLNDPNNQWTWFLPSNAAVDAIESFPDVDLMGHVYANAVLDSQALNGLSGTSLDLRSGDLIEVGGGGTETLTIGDANIVVSDIQGNTSTSTVHIIDKVLIYR